MAAGGYEEIEEQVNSDTFIVSEKIWAFLKKKENIVIDTSVIIKWFFSDNEENTEAAHIILKKFLHSEIGVIAPELALFELTNAVKSKIRSGKNDIIGSEIIDRIYNLGIVFRVTKPVLKEAFDTALVIDESVYDCIFIATAGHFKAKFITDDKRLYLSYQGNKGSIGAGSKNRGDAATPTEVVLLKDYLSAF